MIYVASSWRNHLQPAVVAGLRSAARLTGDDNLLPYDFRHPAEGNEGFHWSQVGMPSYNQDTNGPVPLKEYLHGIKDPISEEGYRHDFEAMKACNTCVLVLPCGRSAHLELGWFIGQGRLTAILAEDPIVPELMYKMVDYISPSLFDLLGWLGVSD